VASASGSENTLRPLGKRVCSMLESLKRLVLQLL
jgi:hypothetical protein